MNNSDMPAMPNSNPETYPTPVCREWAYGITKREHYAGLAMAALLTATNQDGEWCGIDAAAERAVIEADALLAELAK